MYRFEWHCHASVAGSLYTQQITVKNLQQETQSQCCCDAVQEYQKDNRNLVISDTEMKQTVYIYKCENCTIQIKGKVNAITLGQSSIDSFIH